MPLSDKDQLVSVVIPTFNRRDLLQETLQSVFAQTYPHVEIIVVNDGSTDDTATVLERYVSMGQVQHIELDHVGLGRSRNQGLALARGSFICFLDDDDLIPADKIEWQAGVLAESQDVGIVGGSHRVIGQSIGVSSAPPQGVTRDEDLSFETILLENPFISSGATLLRTSVVRSLSGFGETLWATEDWDLWLRAACVTRIVKRDVCALEYRVHGGGMSRDSSRMLAACAKLLDDHLRNLPESRRASLWPQVARHLYEGLGSNLVADARYAARRGRLVKAASLLAGLRPLGGTLVTDAALRRAFVRDLLWG